MTPGSNDGGTALMMETADEVRVVLWALHSAAAELVVADDPRWATLDAVLKRYRENRGA